MHKQKQNKYTFQILEWTKPYPYRVLSDIFPTWEEFYQEVLLTTSVINKPGKIESLKKHIAKMLFYRYKERYPRQQDKEMFINTFIPPFNTYFHTFLTNTSQILKLMDDNAQYDIEIWWNKLSDGNVQDYSTKGATSASPYNIAFDEPNGVLTDDSFSEKSISNTSSTTTYNDVIKRSVEATEADLMLEFDMLLDSFNSLFNNAIITPYIEKSLEEVINFNKQRINTIIEIYNALPDIKKEKYE